MPLESVLGQNRVVTAALTALARPDVNVARLTGPSGSGKSHMAIRAAATWRDGGGTCVFANGQRANSERPLYPLLTLSGTLPKGVKGLAAQSARLAIVLADTVISAPVPTASVFDLLTSALRQKSEQAMRHLSGAEREVIAEVRRLGRSKPILLVAENVHWWDPASLLLLDEMLSERLRDAVPRLQSLKVLLVDTATEQGVGSRIEFGRITESCKESTFETAMPTRADFDEVLASFGLRSDLTTDEIDLLFGITGGHLSLAEQVVAYANGRQAEPASPMGVAESAGLLKSRLALLGIGGAEIEALLEQASIIGTTFSRREIECLVDEETAAISEVLARAEAVRFLRRDPGGSIAFTHEVLRQHFLSNQSEAGASALRKRLAECLSVLRPGDYATRAGLLLEAGEIESGRELSVLAAIDQLRRGHSQERVLSSVVARFPGDPDLVAFLSMMATAYSQVNAGDYRSSLPRLRTPGAGESVLMAAERNYLRALCSIEMQTEQGVEEGLQVLLEWQEPASSESELGFRYLLLQQQAYIAAGQFPAARKTEARIEQQLSVRSQREPAAAVLLQIQNRRASALNGLETAELRASYAVTYFRRGTGDRTRDSLELYRSLVNHSAALSKVGRDAESFAAITEAERLALRLPETVTRIDVLAGNLNCVGYRVGVVRLDHAIARQRSIVASPDGSNENFLHRCNLASYLLRDGKDTEANAVLRELQTEIEAHGYSESYLIYYFSILAVTADLASGNRDSARARLAEFDDFVEDLNWPTAPYILKRHQLLTRHLDEIDPTVDRVGLNRFLLDRYGQEVGPGWAYYAPLMPLSELSFWSDS